MSIEIRPATMARFDDVAIMLGPKNPDSSVCWCLSHRLDARTNRALVGRARGEYVKQLCSRTVAPGVLGYEDLEVVGWAAVAPRSELPFARYQDPSRGSPAGLVGVVYSGSPWPPREGHLTRSSRWCRRVRAVRGCASGRGLPRRQQGGDGRSHDGLRRHAEALRGCRLRQGCGHRLGVRRLSTCPDAAGSALRSARATLRSVHCR
jgi:hypothetical protein